MDDSSDNPEGGITVGKRAYFLVAVAQRLQDWSRSTRRQTPAEIHRPQTSAPTRTSNRRAPTMPRGMGRPIIVAST